MIRPLSTKALVLLLVLSVPLTSSGMDEKTAAAQVSPELSKVPGLVDAVTVVPSLLVEMKYASNDNFLKRNLYGELRQCFLQKDAADKIAKAAEVLKSRDPNLRLLAYDCTRPRRVQVQMWEVVKGTPQQGYVANPKSGSIHNYGCAVDITLATADGKPLPMGTPFDFFGPESGITQEAKLLEEGKLKPQDLANRLLLREVMVTAGFLPLSNEWWHFNCAISNEIRKKYPLVE